MVQGDLLEKEIVLQSEGSEVVYDVFMTDLETDGGYVAFYFIFGN